MISRQRAQKHCKYAFTTDLIVFFYLHAAKQPIGNVFVVTRLVVKSQLAPTRLSHDIKTTKRAQPAPSCHSMPKKPYTGSSVSVYGLIQGSLSSVAHSSARSRCCTPALQPRLAQMGIICLSFQSCVAQSRVAV